MPSSEPRLVYYGDWATGTLRAFLGRPVHEGRGIHRKERRVCFEQPACLSLDGHLSLSFSDVLTFSGWPLDTRPSGPTRGERTKGRGIKAVSLLNLHHSGPVASLEIKQQPLTLPKQQQLKPSIVLLNMESPLTHTKCCRSSRAAVPLPYT